MYLLLLALATIGNGLAEVDDRLDLRLCLLKKGRVVEETGLYYCRPGEPTVLDLGPGHYPRYLGNFQCDGIPCLRPPYYCTGMPYTVQVLKKRENGEAVDLSVPETLKSGWKFVHITVNVGCMCAA